MTESGHMQDAGLPQQDDAEIGDVPEEDTESIGEYPNEG